MAVITKQELIDAADDAQTLEDVANGAVDFGGDGLVHPRLGGDIKTLKKAMSDLQSYTPTGPWNAGSYSLKDLVVDSANDFGGGVGVVGGAGCVPGAGVVVLPEAAMDEFVESSVALANDTLSSFPALAEVFAPSAPRSASWSNRREAGGGNFA